MRDFKCSFKMGRLQLATEGLFNTTCPAKGGGLKRSRTSFKPYMFRSSFVTGQAVRMSRYMAHSDQ